MGVSFEFTIPAGTGPSNIGQLPNVTDPTSGPMISLAKITALALDLSLPGVAAPFAFGLFRSTSTRKAAISVILVGVTSRLAFFFLSPTTYGLPNNLLYIENSLITPAFDGFPTFISPLLAIGTFVVIALVTDESEADSDVPAEQPTVFAEAND